MEVEGYKCYVKVIKAAMKAWMNENKGWKRFKVWLKCKPVIEEITMAHRLSYVVIGCMYIFDRHIYKQKGKKMHFCPRGHFSTWNEHFSQPPDYCPLLKFFINSSFFHSIQSEYFFLKMSLILWLELEKDFKPEDCITQNKQYQFTSVSASSLFHPVERTIVNIN